jgi:hypothetical protein
MSFPDEFKKLAFDVLCARLSDVKSEEELRVYLLEDLKSESRQRLESYLTEILDGRYNDKEINALWDKTGTDIMFFRPEAARAFLLKVRDWLAQGNPP